MLTIQEIQEMIKLIDQSSIDEFTYEANGTKMKMKKTGGSSIQIPKTSNVNDTYVIANDSQKQVSDIVETKVQEVVSEQPVQTNTVDYDYEIVSPMVGTLYSSATPEADKYVQVGSKVNQNTVVCIVEAMKLFNEIEAEVNGEIVEILVEDGELVEYGQPLFRVKTK